MAHRRVLIANRGEIAIRIARAAAGLGMKSTAIFAPVDSLSLHTRAATDARELSSSADAVGAYLDQDAVLHAARVSESDCVHPGYGFLSENAEFARRCEAEGLTFIGPSPEALELFGDKVRSRELAQSLDIPVVPGSEAPLGSAEEACALAESVGYPAMLKAAAGGGGRGMRQVNAAEEMAAAFERCAGEAQAAFGRGDVFLEKLIERPRHIEVQVLGDSRGNVVHLFERDCSVQERNQKVVEIAPAPGLDPTLRARLHRDALRLVREAGYRSAGTVEFLVAPESGDFWFIECNPRLQVEHTVTEEVLGLDVVEAQFRIAAGATLEELGLGSQESVPEPRGYAVQARVVAQGAGTLTTYVEPSGPGVRVDAMGYLGYAPPPQFDPLLAKVIGSAPQGDVARALDRTTRALGEFHIDGLPTNIGALCAILGHAALRKGDARTTLLQEQPALLHPAPQATAPGSARELLVRQTSSSAAGPAAPSGGAAARVAPELVVGDGQRGAECPMAGTLVELLASPGQEVRAGEALAIVSAMKMEAEVAAPCAGVVAAVQELRPGDPLDAGQVVATLTVDVEQGETAPDPDTTWAPVLEEVRTLQGLAHERLGPHSQERGVVRQRRRGKLTCRQRIDLLLDEGSFREVGSLAGFASYGDDGETLAFTPANHVGGWGTIDQRKTIVCADDFTSRGGHADGSIGAKSHHLDRLSLKLRVPAVRMLDGSSGGGSVAAMVPQQKKEGESTAKESSGAIKAGQPRVSGGGGSFLPGHLGSTMFSEQLATVPVVNMLLGSVVGIGAAKAVLGHFSVMVRDISQLFVAGPPVVSHAMGYDITKEDLGGWHVHCRNGSVDNLAETEEEAAHMTRRFLSYLPPSVYEAPPVTACSDPLDRREEELFTLIPRKRTSTFDIRRAIELIADAGSFFEIGPHWGTDQVTGFVRFAGVPMGVVATDSRHENGGALTADGCRKLKRHLDVCDLFHLPVVNLVDNPGFAVGLEHEIASTIRWGGEWMVAFAQVQVPIFTVLMRRSFGVAGNNYATPRITPEVRVAWPSADVGGIPPEGGIEAAYKRQLAEADDPAALRAEIEARIEAARGPVGPLNRFQLEEMIDPRDTRRYICEWAPDAHRLVSQPAGLGSRALQFRP